MSLKAITVERGSGMKRKEILCLRAEDPPGSSYPNPKNNLGGGGGGGSPLGGG
jgi:hypothetical protein